MFDHTNVSASPLDIYVVLHMVPTGSERLTDNREHPKIIQILPIRLH